MVEEYYDFCHFVTKTFQSPYKSCHFYHVLTVLGKCTLKTHWPGNYHMYKTTFWGIGSDLEKMLAHWGIKAETGVFDNNVYREAATGRFIRHEELCYWIKNGCRADAKFKPWLNSDD